MGDEAYPFRDDQGTPVYLGDVLETPADASDPVTAAVAYLFVKWPFGDPMAVLVCGNYGGRGGVLTPVAAGRLICRKDEYRARLARGGLAPIEPMPSGGTPA